MPRWFVFALVSAAFWGIWALVFAEASKQMSPMVALVLSTLGLTPVALGLLFTRTAWNRNRMKYGFSWGLVTGALGALGNAAFSLAILSGGETSVITPLTAMFPLLTLVLAVTFLREHINLVQVGGLVTAVLAIFLFNSEGGIDTGLWVQSLTAPWMLSALLTLAIYAVQGITQKLSTNDISDELSTATYLFGSALVAVGVIATQQMDWSITPTAWALALGSGVLMGLGLWAGFAAYRGGKASIVTAIVALYPVLTVILAIAGGEPLTVVKGLAIAMALAAGLTMAYERAPALVQAG